MRIWWRALQTARTSRTKKYCFAIMEEISRVGALKWGAEVWRSRAERGRVQEGESRKNVGLCGFGNDAELLRNQSLLRPNDGSKERRLHRDVVKVMPISTDVRYRSSCLCPILFLTACLHCLLKVTHTWYLLLRLRKGVIWIIQLIRLKKKLVLLCAEVAGSLHLLAGPTVRSY